MLGHNMWLAWLSWSFLLIEAALPRDCSATTTDDSRVRLQETRAVEVERRVPEPIIVTITLTTTISLVPSGYPTAPMATHTPIPWTVPGGSLPQITITRSRTTFTSAMDTTISTSLGTSLGISSTVGTASTTNIGATSTSTFTTEPGTPGTTFVTTTSSSSVTLSSTTGLETISAVITTDTSNAPSTTSSASLTSIFSDPSPSVVEGSTSATSSATQEGTATALPPPASADLQSHSLAPGQIAAVVVGAIAFTIFVSVVAYLVRFAVMRRRQSSAEKRQRLDGQDATTMEQRYYPGGAAAAAAASRSRSLHEGEFRIVIRTPPPAAAPGEEEEEQRMRQLWPSPPGGTQRFTFFSGRSTTTATDSATDRGQWSQGTENGSSGPSHGYRNP